MENSSAFAPADPVALHDLDPVGPVELVEVVEQFLGVVGDAEEPLLEVALFDHIPASLARAVGQHLLIGQHRVAAGAPVDRGVGAIHQAGFEEPQEDGLRESHVFGIVAADLTTPVVDRPDALDAFLELGDALVGEDPWMHTRLDGCVLGREPEAVEAEGAQDGVALHGLVANEKVAEGVVAHVTHVRRAARVRVHAEDVERRPGIVVVDLVGAFVLPAGLPLALGRLDVVGLGHGRRC